MSVSIAPVAKEGRDEASRWHNLVPLDIYTRYIPRHANGGSK